MIKKEEVQMVKIDVFTCYRRYGAQTAKLFQRYLKERCFPGEVWYSDDEVYGNYRNDTTRLISEAECAVLFIDPDFTKGFIDEGGSLECITAKEIVEIGKKFQRELDFRIITIFLDRTAGFSIDESKVIVDLFKKDGVKDYEVVANRICQSNAVFFSTSRDVENDLFSRVSKEMLPDSYYKNRVPSGNFYFGNIPTSVDIAVWDVKTGIKPENVSFAIAPMRIPMYERVERCRADITYEPQNNQMVSLVGKDVFLTDDVEEKVLSIRYQKIEYRLFYKALMLWDQLELNKVMAGFDYQTESYSIPNAMGLAFMVITADQKLLFSRRSSKRKVRPLQYDCSIVEGLKTKTKSKDGEEYEPIDEGYLITEIERAFKEEVCSTEENLDIQINGLVIDKEYGQWNLVGTICTSKTADEIRHQHSIREDTYEDNQMIVVSMTDDSGVLCMDEVEKKMRRFLDEGMWGMALTTVYAALLRVGFTSEDIEIMTTKM